MGLIMVKAIKPSKLKFDPIRLECLSEMHKVSRLVRDDLEKTTETWTHAPTWKEEITLRDPGPTFYVYATGPEALIYKFVDEGTKPHEIWAGWYTGKSEHKRLAFPSMFEPKTVPNEIASYAGSSGGPTVYAAHVNHPGTTARRFLSILQEKWDSLFKDHIEDAMKRAAEKSGHKL